MKDGEQRSNNVASTSSEELFRDMPLAPPRLGNRKKRLSKQLSMCETPRDVAWERRRRRIRGKSDMITDEDLHDLKGCIELGFGFTEEEEGQRLCNTLPALDIYFAVNRQLSPSPVSTPSSRRSTSSPPVSSLGGRSSSFECSVPTDSEPAWKICSPGDDPQQVKTKLRHWAQAVACSMKQFS